MSTTLDLASIKPSLGKLQAIERELTATLIERDEVIRASLVTLLARQHLVVLGPPGTAKSALVTELSERISPQNGAGLRSFGYLMTRFTTPEELFGPVSVSGLKRDEYRRITAGKLVEAELVFLDEIFKASSAILNALLKIANERVFHNGDQEMQAPLISLFGASNEMPQGNELEALRDRFLLRFRVGYVTDTGFAKFIRAASAKLGAKQNGHKSNGNQPATLLQSELGALQQSAEQIAIPNATIDLIEQLRKDLAGKGIIISDRRWGQSLGVLQAHALTEGRDAVTEDDPVFLKHVLWQSPEQQAEIGKAVARIGNPLNSKAVDYEDQAASVHRECMDAQRTAQGDEQKMQAAIEANTKLKQIGVRLQELHEQAVEQGALSLIIREPNKLPQVTSLTPNPVVAGGQNFMLTVNGRDFIAGSTVRWDGNDRSTTFVNATQLTAAIPAGDIVATRDVKITVFTPEPGGGRSNEMILTIANAVANVSAASFSGALLAPDSIVAAFGVRLATAVRVATTIPLPTELEGTTLRVKDSAGAERLARLFFVAPGQINYLMPPETVAGPATVTVRSGDGIVAVGAVQIAMTAPSLFTANADGKGVATGLALRVKADGTQVYEPISRFDEGKKMFVPLPIDLGNENEQVFLILNGSGIRNRSSLSAVTVTIGGMGQQVLFAGAVEGLAGFDQVNVGPLSRSLVGRGEVDVVLTVDGKQANTVRVSFK